MRIKTQDGFEVRVNKEALNSMEAVDALAEIEDGNPLAISRLCSFLFSKEEKRKVYDHLRGRNNRVPIETFIPFITEVMNLLGESEKK